MLNISLNSLILVFISEFRSVRQDMILQTCSDDVQLTVLGACVRFHVVFGHLLANTTTFSKHINFQHQLECMKSCLLLDESKLQDTERSHLETIQCLYLLSNLDSAHALTWAIGVSNRSDDLGEMSLFIFWTLAPAIFKGAMEKYNDGPNGCCLGSCFLYRLKSNRFVHHCTTMKYLYKYLNV